MNASKFITSALGVGIALAATVPATAAPVVSTAALKAAAPDQVTDVRWRGGAAVAAGIGAGLALGAIASSPYSYGYGYGPTYYGPAYGYYGAPAYGYAPDSYAVGPSYGYYQNPNGCYVEGGYNRRMAC